MTTKKKKITKKTMLMKTMETKQAMNLRLSSLIWRIRLRVRRVFPNLQAWMMNPLSPLGYLLMIYECDCCVYLIDR